MASFKDLALAFWLLPWCAAPLATAQVRADDNVDIWLTHRDAHPEAVLTKPLGNEVIYQIFVDRFADGNPDNNCVDGRQFCDPLHQDWFRFWGGDLRGVIEHLPYLKHLGVTRLWLTPIFANQMVQSGGGMTPYHGYWIRDWFRLSPYFTDHGAQDYGLIDELVRAAGPDVRLLLDTVANHTSPTNPSAASLQRLDQVEPLDQSDGILRTHRGALYRDGSYIRGLDEDQQHAASDRIFHPYGSITDYNNQFQVENYRLDGLNDLDQSSPIVQRYLHDAHDFWLARFPGIAGYRMDTVKHVPLSYWHSFDSTLQAEHPGAEVVGEYYGGGPYTPQSQDYYRTTHATIFDFNFHDAVTNVFLHGSPISDFTRLWQADPAMGDARALVTFIDNHDIARLRGLGVSLRRMQQALALMFAARGIPCVLYGLEQDLFYPHDPGDPYNRLMMNSFEESGLLFSTMQKMTALRKENAALRYGNTHVVHQSDRILGFERVLDGSSVFFVTSVNPITGADHFEIRGLSLPDGIYPDVLTGQNYQVQSGRITVDLRDGDTVLLSTSRRK